MALVFLIAGNLCFHKELLRIDAFGGTGGYANRKIRTTRFRTRKQATSLFSSYNDSNNDSTASYWRIPNDFSMFLTQRSIQSFMFLARQLRDPETCYWVENFTQPNLVKLDIGVDDELDNSNSDVGGMSDAGDTATESKDEERTCHLLRYHGLAAMDTALFPTWQDFFERMLEQPTDTWVIASDQPHIPDYEWEIDPLSLCSRILSVREQLSKEFVRDLQAVSDMGGQTFDWYWEKLKQSRENNRAESDDEASASQFFIEPSSLRGSRENLLFLEINVDDPTLDHKPSPLRRSNFDLLVLLATEEAIHRVLNRWELKRAEGDLVGAEYASHVFLEEFYQQRQHFFHGPLQSYGKADDLLEELLDSALLFKADGSNADGVVHPTKIAELVLKERERVALEWMEIAKEAPQHHMRIQALRLEKMMNPNPTPSEETNNNDAGPSPSEIAQNYNGGFDAEPGAFE